MDPARTVHSSGARPNHRDPRRGRNSRCQPQGERRQAAAWTAIKPDVLYSLSRRLRVCVRVLRREGHKGDESRNGEAPHHARLSSWRSLDAGSTSLSASAAPSSQLRVKESDCFTSPCAGGLGAGGDADCSSVGRASRASCPDTDAVRSRSLLPRFGLTLYRTQE